MKKLLALLLALAMLFSLATLFAGCEDSGKKKSSSSKKDDDDDEEEEEEEEDNNTEDEDQGDEKEEIAQDAVITGKVTVGGIDIQDMTRQDAESALMQAFEEEYADKYLYLDIDGAGEVFKLTFSSFRITLDTEKLMQDVFAWENEDAPKELSFGNYLNVDREKVKQLVSSIHENYSGAAVQSAYEVVGTAPQSYTEMDINANLCLQITKGKPGIAIDVDKLAQLLMDELLDDSWDDVDYTPVEADIAPLDFEAIYQECATEPVDAYFQDKTFQVMGGTYGYAFDQEEAETLFASLEPGSTVSLAFQWIEPDITVRELESTLYTDELASYSTHDGSNSDRNTNLKLAAEAINGTIIYPGETFSFNDTVGQPTAERGYRPALGYADGEVKTMYGGGISQVSSTLYYCAVVADLKIVARQCHLFATSYTPLSTDANVQWGKIDFKFQNNWNYPIRIDATAENGSVYITLYGTDEKDYFVKFESTQEQTHPYETVYREMPADNSYGYEDGDVIVSPYTGYTSTGYRTYYSKTTNKQIEKAVESTDVYSSRNKVICKIISPEPEPEPEPEPTEPQPEPTKPGGGGPIELPMIPG